MDYFRSSIPYIFNVLFCKNLKGNWLRKKIEVICLTLSLVLVISTLCSSLFILYFLSEVPINLYPNSSVIKALLIKITSNCIQTILPSRTSESILLAANALKETISNLIIKKTRFLNNLRNFYFFDTPHSLRSY